MRSSLLTCLCGVLWLGGCTQVTDGIEVDVGYAVPATPQAVVTDAGYRVWLRRAVIAMGPVELIECDNFARLLTELFTPGRARAHEPTTPTRLGVPFVLDVMESQGGSLFAGTIRPPPGRYCGLRVTKVPADRDAVGLKHHVEMLESSVFLTGEVEDRNTRQRSPLRLEVREALIQELWFDEPLIFERPKSVRISVWIDPLAWFDGIDFARLAPAAVQQKLVENIVLSMVVERH